MQTILYLFIYIFFYIYFYGENFQETSILSFILACNQVFFFEFFLFYFFEQKYDFVDSEIFLNGTISFYYDCSYYIGQTSQIFF